MRWFTFLFMGLVLSLGASAQDSLQKAKPAGYYLKRSLPSIGLLGLSAFTWKDFGPISSYSIREEVQRQASGFHTNADDYLRWAPIPAVYVFDALGIKAKNSFAQRSWILLKGEVLMAGVVYGLKYTTGITRPDGSDDHSFPSGHAAQAFLGATFIAFELGHHSILYPIVAYTFATGIAAMAVYDDRHWFSDVAAGAAIGISSMQLVYWTHRNKIKFPIALHPFWNQKSMGMYASFTF